MSGAMARWFGGPLTAAARVKAGGLAFVVCSGSLLALPGCEAAPELSEWTLADHDNQVEAKRRRSTGVPKTHAPPSQRNQLIDVTWMKQCSSCHGKRGKGDGPSSAMIKARDLSNAEWQASVTDEAMATVIRQGREKMPAFNLPDSMIQGLIGHIREMADRPRHRREDDEGAAADEATTSPASSSDAPAQNGTSPAPAPKSAVPAAEAAPAAGRPTPGR
jgi:cytochrome c oxidase cbb3-type subunit 3